MRRIALFVLVGVFAITPVPAWGADSPRYGGTLVIAISANPALLNPAIAGATEQIVVGCKMFNSLIYVDRDWNPQPELAKSWTISPDGRVYTFKLVENARWHDGKPFTSADVKFSFEEVSAKYHHRMAVALATLERIDTPDPYTVVVRFKNPYAPFLEALTCQNAPILPKHLYEGTDILKNPHNQSPVGTGPFRFESYTRGDKIVMVRNNTYFRPGLPYLDRLVAKVMPDAASRTLALEAGEVDHIQSYFLLKQEVARLKANPNLQVKYDTDLPGNYILFFNVTRGPLADKRVRQALATGLNRRQILEQAAFGLGSPGKSAIHAKLWAYNPTVDYDRLYPYDPTKANRMLDSAGFARGTDGTRFKIRFVYDVAQANFGPIAEIVRSNWKDLGVQVVLEPFEVQLAIDMVFTKGDFDLNIQDLTTGGDPAIGITRAYQSMPRPAKAYTNPTGYSNPAVDELFRRAISTPVREERRKIYFEAQRVIADDLPALNVIDLVEADAASAKFKGLWISAQPYDEFDQVWWVGGKLSR